MDFKKDIYTLSPITISLIYLVVAAVWILFTDRLVVFFFKDSEIMSLVQTYKGWFFVLISTLGLYYLISKHTELKEKLTQDRLLDQELLAKLFKNIPVMITVYKPSLDKIEINKAFTDLTGYTMYDVKSTNIMEACYPDTEYREMIADFMSRPGSGWRDIIMQTKFGEQIFTSWTNITLTDQTQVGIGVDLTEINKTREEQLKNKIYLRNVFESLEESVLLIDPKKYTIIDCNDATLKIFGYSKDELLDKSSKILHVDEEHYQKFIEKSVIVLQNGNVFKTEYVLKCKSGEIINTDHTITISRNELGELNQVVSVIRDITEKKRAEIELKERNNFIEAIIDNVPIGIAVNKIDDGSLTLINKQFSDIYGWTEDDVNNVDDFFRNVYQDEEFRDKMKERITADMMSGDPERMQWEKIPIDTKDQGKRFVNAKNIPVPEQNLMISTVLDVSERARAEIELKESEAKYRHLFENNPQPMWIFDLDTNQFLEVNNAAIREYGYSKEEFLSMNILDIRPESERERVEQHLDKLIELNNTEDIWIHQKKNGEKILANVYGTTLKYGSINARLILINNITEKIRYREKLINAAVEGENRERKRLAQELHDGIGQYLSAVNLNLESIKKEIDNLSEKRRNRFLTSLNFIKKAMKETRAMAYTLMPAELDDYGLKVALLSLSEQIEKTAEIHIKVMLEFDENQLDAKIRSNLYRITQEAIKNAIQHGKSDEILIDYKAENNFLKCIIKDNGIGVDLKKLDTNKSLGFRNMKARVEAMSGDITLNSTLRNGLEILITLPLN